MIILSLLYGGGWIFAFACLIGSIYGKKRQPPFNGFNEHPESVSRLLVAATKHPPIMRKLEKLVKLVKCDT